MFKLIGFLVVVTGSFALGFYVGQHNIQDAKQAVINLSKYALDSALGMGKDTQLKWRGELLEAKSRILQAKSELLDKNFGNAKREVAKAWHLLEKASHAQPEPGEKKKIERVVDKTRNTHEEMTGGTLLPRSRLDEIQQDLDGLLTD